MSRLIGIFLFAFVSSLACAQSLQPEHTACLRNIMDSNRVWSPDCRSYFVRSRSAARDVGISSLDVYSIHEKTTYVNSAVEEIRCDLAIESLGKSSVQFHHIEWLDSDRLRLQVALLRSSGASSHTDYSYVVNAHTGKILETTFPAHRNWNCSTSPRVSGGPAI
jgi:hypothetical protein